MQRILSIYDWQMLPEGQQAVVNSDIPEQRAVRLRVNSPGPVAIYVKQEDVVDPFFLANVLGLDEIQFNVTGGYKLFAMGGELWFDTLDGTRPDVEAVAPASFTSIVERQVRNPELELMERKMQENIERRMAAVLGAVSTRLEANERELLAARTALEESRGQVPEQAAGPVPPAEETVEAPSAEQGTGDE